MIRRAILLVFLAAAAAGVWAGWRQYAQIAAPYRGYAEAEQFVDVPSGIGTRAIGTRLVQAGVVRDLTTWRLAVWRSGQATALKAGEYRFSGAISPAEAVAKLARGDVYLRAITFPEGLTVRQMAAIFEDAGFGPAAEFNAAAGAAHLVRAFDPAARNLEGYLFPDTYALPRRTSALELVRRMVARFEAVLTPDLRQAASDLGLSVREAVTLASLVEKETAAPDERPLVSAVYHNRLRQRMGLQCDPTVIYALQLRGRFDGNLTRADLAIDSPYNTYRYRGLPPGPIAAPGRLSLEAAVRPAPADYVYFVSRNDGSHAFASTLAEHNRNVRTYQVEFFRKQARAPGKPAPRQ
ncbi:MAG: endolytic transglycosylase MltG [Vicinamibacterales bacterium]